MPTTAQSAASRALTSTIALNSISKTPYLPPRRMFILLGQEANSLLDYCEGSKLDAHELDRSTICAARSRANMACGYRRLGGHSGVEPIVQGSGPGRRQSIWPARGVRFDCPGRRHESLRDRSGGAVALRSAHPRALVPRQRDGGSAGLRLCAGAPARAVIRVCGSDRRGAWVAVFLSGS